MVVSSFAEMAAFKERSDPICENWKSHEFDYEKLSSKPGRTKFGKASQKHYPKYRVEREQYD